MLNWAKRNARSGLWPELFHRFRSGLVGINNGHLRFSGIDGYAWSSRANSSDLRYTYSLDFYASSVNLSSYGNHWNAFHLRF